MTILICSDRDGTINVDHNYYLGKDPNWKAQVKFLPGVPEGIKLLKTLDDSFFVFLTNQSGVAIDDEAFKPFTLDVMYEVNRHIIEQLKKEGAIVDGYFACPFVDMDYVMKKSEKHTFDNCYVVNKHPDLKPNTGLVEKAKKKFAPNGVEMVYMIGDRKSDVVLGLNTGGKSILVPAFKTAELGDLTDVQGMQNQYGNRIYIAKDFLDASKWIFNDIAELRGRD